ncbi:hypothetical protein OZL92_10690 [Bacillus sonorensis]|uniref:Uncharacterized protein n=2 Tax=Bacillus sonorensis TaxID=119858 RepID=M5P0I1_9BACI|nr:MULTISPECIES: hypothetical protein [Bacillus]TWK75636.1 hypothetical protein CHCC20335_0891 [Bacillus paralicheniformis]ASB90546.1 hypothetical protein S101395_04044 [Bacillus sonorensis]EME72949.1 hypothetical protein BSONL12_14464 [Bacillus sonorensis L12]MBG9913966.1 hypothetical protein [Bacillus sonorensis]MCF7616809.1 hypothetical protein [Bacillus sonorensis]
MEWSRILAWAFQRHLNPLSWYIRPVFLIVLVYFCYKRSWKGIAATFVLMMSSMVWFPEPETINRDMQVVLEYERMLLADPVKAILTVMLMMMFLILIGTAFWRRSIKWGLVLVNVTLIGKVALSLLFTGESGWAPLGNTLFGLILVNGIGAYVIARRKNRKADV